MPQANEEQVVDNEPWKKALATAWRCLTVGRLKYVTIPVFLVAVILPATVGFIDGAKNVYGYIVPLFVTPTTLITPEERDLLEQEEWGLIVDTADSKSEAKERLAEFKNIYLQSGHTNYMNQAIWKNDILLVRDPRKVGRWLVVIDMYPGPSTRSALQAGVNEMIESEREANIRGEPLERWLNGSAPYQFERIIFEKTYGKIVNLGN